METRVDSLNDGFAVHLTKFMAESLGFSDGSTVHAEVVDGKLVVSLQPLGKLKIRSAKYTLAELLSKIPEDYNPAEDEELREWRDAPPVGKEFW